MTRFTRKKTTIIQTTRQTIIEVMDLLVGPLSLIGRKNKIKIARKWRYGNERDINNEKETV